MSATTTECFITTPFLQEIMERTIHYLSAGYPVHFTGATGIGKTALAGQIAQQLDRPVTIIRGNHELSNFDLLGGLIGYSKKQVIDNYIHTVLKTEEEVRSQWQNGPLCTAVREGHILIYDEFTRSRPETNNLFLSLLEERVLPVYGMGEQETQILCHPEFKVIFTSNSKEYAGVFQTQDALLDRMITIDLELYDLDTEISILEQKASLSTEESRLIVEWIRVIREVCKKESGQEPSLRASTMIATVCKQAGIRIALEDTAFQQVCFDVLSPFLKRDILQNELNKRL